MSEFIKKNIYLIILFIITLFIGFLTFLTFINKGFIELNDQNLQYLLILNIVLLITLFVFIFIEINKAIKNDIDKDGLKSNKKYITYFALFTLIPSVLISIFSLFLFSFALDKYFDKKVTTVVNNSYELAKNYVDEIRNKIQSDIVLIAIDTNKSKKFLNDNQTEYKRFLNTQKIIRNVDEIHIIDINKKILFTTLNDNQPYNPPVDEADYNSRKDEMFDGEAPTWTEIKSEMDNYIDPKVSAKQKLIAGEKLTEEEANILVGV